jgi:Catalytic LigB subunit of aromatic ring-opening dioxygenase
MPLGLGLATSHAPSMFQPAERWPDLHRILVRDNPQPPAVAEETPEVLAQYVDRIDKALATLEQTLVSYRPDALILVGDDQNEVFSRAIEPQMAIFLGGDVSGTTSLRLLGEPLTDNHIKLRCHAELASHLIDGLVARGFDVCPMHELQAMSRPEGGLGHAFTRPSRALRLADHDIPVVVFFLNAYHEPLPTARRCYQLGRAISELLANRPERVAILGSGGLSHDPLGPRAGWIDQQLDRWILQTIEAGRARELQRLFTFGSDTFHGGTGEVRSWIVVAAALEGVKATVVDYLPAHHAVTGLGFTYWSTNGSTAP